MPDEPPTTAELHRNQVRIDLALDSLRTQFGSYVTIQFLNALIERLDQANKDLEHDLAEERQTRVRADSDEKQARKEGDASNAREINKFSTTIRWAIGTLIAVAALGVTIYSIRGH